MLVNRYLTVFLAVAMLGGAGHAWAQKAPPVLTNAELKTLLSNGLTVRLTGAERKGVAARTGTAVYEKDGTIRFNEGPATMTHTGSWRIDGNKFCTKYTNLGSGCFNLQKTGEGTYRAIPLDGLLEVTWQVVKK